MKKVLIFSLSAALLSACGGSQPASTTNSTATTNTTASPAAAQKNTSDPLVVSSHSTEKKSDSMSSTQPASPNQMPIDVADMSAKITEADKALKAKPADEKLKQALAAAYFERAFALTKAAQYRAALGDFRKGLKLNPNDAEAKSMHDQIIDIFKSIGREPPKEGEEPPPMPMK